MWVQPQQRCLAAFAVWPYFGGYEAHGGLRRHDSLPPIDVVATAPGIAEARLATGLGSQFLVF